MLPYCQPPAQQATAAMPELPLLPDSDPMLLGAYQWTVAHSPSLQAVVRQLATTDKKAHYRLVPGLDAKFSLTVSPTQDGYEINVEVPVLAWSQCGDAVEPWIASALFLMLEAISKEKYREQSGSKSYALLRESVSASFAFQNRVKKELVAADPERLRDLPDGRALYESRFRPRSSASPSERPARRALPP